MEDFRITDIYSGQVDREPKKDNNRFQKETGFPSPARDHFEKPLSLDEYIIKRPAATFFMRVKGDGLNEIGIFSDDILVIDRSINAVANHLIVAILEGEMVVRKLIKKGNTMYVTTTENEQDQLEITNELDFEIWGVVSYAIHKYI